MLVTRFSGLSNSILSEITRYLEGLLGPSPVLKELSLAAASCSAALSPDGSTATGRSRRALSSGWRKRLMAVQFEKTTKASTASKPTSSNSVNSRRAPCCGDFLGDGEFWLSLTL